MRKLPMTEKELEELLAKTNLKGVVSKDKLKNLIKLYESLKTKVRGGLRNQRLKDEAEEIEHFLSD